MVCCSGVADLVGMVAPIGTVGNSLLPHSDQSQVEGDRKTKLGSLLDDLDWRHLTPSQKDGLRQVILENDTLFILNDEELGELKVQEAHIETIDPDPVRAPL